MRFTERQIDSFDRMDQIKALKDARSYLVNLNNAKAACANANQQVEQLNKQVKNIRKGIGAKVAPIAIILGISLLGSSILGPKEDRAFMIPLAILAIAIVVICFLENKIGLSAREEKANRFYAEHSGSVLNAKAVADARLNKLLNSDDAYNVNLILPKQYLNIETLDTLIELLSYRRARSISEALMVYDEMERKRRLERMEEEKLKAAQDAAASQRQAAMAAERAAQSAKRTEEINRKMQQDNARNNEQQFAWMRQQAEKNAADVSTPKIDHNKKKCPYCKEYIDRKAGICPYCHGRPSTFWYL